jgi:hypothetical protein
VLQSAWIMRICYLLVEGIYDAPMIVQTKAAAYKRESCEDALWNAITNRNELIVFSYS